MADISIIIPMYNAASTIERCIFSLLSTDIPIEVICVNDGSTDNTRAIVSEICKRDNRVILLNQINMGASAARNSALPMANSEYIMFCGMRLGGVYKPIYDLRRTFSFCN